MLTLIAGIILLAYTWVHFTFVPVDACLLARWHTIVMGGLRRVHLRTCPGYLATLL